MDLYEIVQVPIPQASGSLKYDIDQGTRLPPAYYATLPRSKLDWDYEEKYRK